MAHHSDEIRGSAFEQFVKELELGATGKFPEGVLDPTDEGEIKIGITVKDGNVVIAFGKPTAWIGFTPDQADEIARLLITRAIEARE